jgi:transposase InsO family protein
VAPRVGEGPTFGGFIERAAADVAAHGITSIERVITDNHFSYRKGNDVKSFTALGATHKFIRPHCPWQNGKVERLNRTLATEWAYQQVFTTNHDRAAALAPLARALQHSTPPQRTRRPPTDLRLLPT